MVLPCNVVVRSEGERITTSWSLGQDRTPSRPSQRKPLVNWTPPVGARRRQGVVQGAAADRQASTCSARSLADRWVPLGEAGRRLALDGRGTPDHSSHREGTKTQVTDARKITSTQNAAR
ncbi:hypothetical protein ACIP6I_14500 [Streptomyces anulatus]